MRVAIDGNGDQRTGVLCDDDWAALERAGTIVVDARTAAADDPSRCERWVRAAALQLHLVEVYDVRRPPLCSPLLLHAAIRFTLASRVA